MIGVTLLRSLVDCLDTSMLLERECLQFTVTATSNERAIIRIE